jgi:hypothetical protein
VREWLTAQDIKANHLLVAIKGQQPIIDVRLRAVGHVLCVMLICARGAVVRGAGRTD